MGKRKRQRDRAIETEEHAEVSDMTERFSRTQGLGDDARLDAPGASSGRRRQGRRTRKRQRDRAIETEEHAELSEMN